MVEHTLRAFDSDLAALKDQVATLGRLALSETEDATRALVTDNPELARRVIDQDRNVDVLEVSLQETAVRLVALRQPVAEDLRHAVAALKTAADLERCGDLAKNTAKRAVALEGWRRPAPLMSAFESLDGLVRKRLQMVLQAYAEDDLIKADDVWSKDEEVDAAYEKLSQEIIGLMMSDPQAVTAGSQLLFVAKNLERIGDHATNVAEIVHYRLTGEQLTARPKIETAGI